MAIPIGTQALHAAGFAMGAKFDGKPVVSLVYFGDGAPSEGDTHEALNFAAVFRAPCVFFCQNNQYAISETNARQFLLDPIQKLSLLRRAKIGGVLFADDRILGKRRVQLAADHRLAGEIGDGHRAGDRPVVGLLVWVCNDADP
jgi:hypothetical protein